MEEEVAPQPNPGDKNPPQVVQEHLEKLEIDNCTFIVHKKVQRLLCNFTFCVNAHSLILDNDGEQIYILACGTQDGNVFHVPISSPDTDSVEKISFKINRFKAGNNAVMHKKVAIAGNLPSMIRMEIDRYKANNIENQRELLVLGETGVKFIEKCVWQDI